MRTVLALLLACSTARAQPPCGPTGAEITRYDALQPGVRGWIDFRWDGRDWLPVRGLRMPMHHASRIEWTDAADHPELTSARTRTLRISFVVVDRRLEQSRHEGVLVDATYRLDIESICAAP